MAGRQKDYFAALYEVAKVVNASLTPSQVMKKIVSCVAETMSVKAYWAYSFFFLPLFLRTVSAPMIETKSTVASPRVSYALKSSSTAVTKFGAPVLSRPFST